MPRLLFLALGLALMLPIPSSPAAEEDPLIKITLGPSVEIGRRDLLFASVTSVCEDEAGHFYVLDRMEFKVRKFAPDGRPVLSFGRKGQGPGDLAAPASVVFTSTGELAVLEDLGLVSFFGSDGAFRRRLDLNGRLGLGYVGPDRYYGWIWRPEDRQQVLVNAKNAAVATFDVQPRDAFSVILPDETGRSVMFNYFSDIYVPGFLFDHNAALSAVGISDRYRLALLDEEGRTAGTLTRDLGPQRITARDKIFLERELAEFVKSKGWPERVGRELAKKIPAVKNPVRAVRISPNRVFVFRFPPDITRRDAPVPVDAFTRKGELLGEAELPEVPLHVSDKAMYFVRTDADGNVYLVRTEYAMSAAR
ncbi:MAG: hypothetical protein HGA94_06205 [Candidatus Aminicenantes bacterium]|nr:hypothetical protein [Candidatus Aminicenantes bacterium]